MFSGTVIPVIETPSQSDPLRKKYGGGVSQMRVRLVACRELAGD